MCAIIPLQLLKMEKYLYFCVQIGFVYSNSENIIKIQSAPFNWKYAYKYICFKSKDDAVSFGAGEK